jgi:ABC-2 type transport system ATP-binding protein
MLAVETKSLRLSYGKGSLALGGIDLSIEPGELFGLLGPNGAGKSTALKVLATILRPSGGSARVMGIDVARYPGRARRVLGFVPQDSGVDPYLTGFQNIYFHARIHGLRHRAARQRAGELLEEVGLGGRGGEKARVYSGGMRKLLDVACAFVHRPQVVLMDEPTLGLDLRSRNAVWGLVEELRRVNGAAVVLTTHYLWEADALCDRVAMLERGRLTIEGKPSDLKRASRTELVAFEMEGSAAALSLAQERIASLGCLRHLVNEDGVWVAAVAEGASAIPLIVEAARESGARVVRARVDREGLDGIFLESTGGAGRRGEPVAKSP